MSNMAARRTANEPEIVKALRAGMFYKEVEDKYGICDKTITRIKKRNGLAVRKYVKRGQA